MGISTSGVGSGIDIKDLVTRLIEAESKDKKIKFDTDEITITSKISAYGKLKSNLSDFQDLLTQWRYDNPFENKLVNVSSYNGNTVVSATATSKATNGNYLIEVDQLAKNYKIGSSTTFNSASEMIGTGTLIFESGLQVYTFDITNSNSSLQSIVDTVNSASNRTGISASLIGSSQGETLIFYSQNTGTDNVFKISVQDSDGNNVDNNGLSQLASNNLVVFQDAKNANLKIEGVSIVSDSNVVNSAIEGVSLNLLDLNINSPVLLTINDDIDNAKKCIINYVNNCNVIFGAIHDMTAYGGAQGGKSGILIGEATLRTMDFQIRRVGNGLSQIGITTDQYTGKLKIDEQKLDFALNNNFNAVADIFSEPKNGVVFKMGSLIDNYINMKGTLQSKIDGLNKDIILINEQRLKLERHLYQFEKRLVSQFIAMDKTVARLRSVSDFLKTQLDSLPKPMGYNK